jgi:undecaprenyl-diphosphatase
VVAAGGQHLISYFQAIVIGLLQGVTELFPISSLGHAVILPKLLGWHLGQDKPYFLAFLVATHLATATVLFAFFFPEWARILKGLGRSLRDRQISDDDPDARLAWLLIVGTIPAGLIGLLFEHKLRSLFASPTAAAAFLTANGLILFAAEYLRRRAPGAEARARELERSPKAETSSEAEKRLATLGFREAVGVGTAQAAALFPGISRAGVTIGGGLFVGLTHEDAARYAFLLATPIIGAAALLRSRCMVRDQVPDALLPDEHADAVRRVLPLRRSRRTGRLRVLEWLPQRCPHVARWAVEMLKKENFANCGHDLFRPLDSFA